MAEKIKNYIDEKGITVKELAHKADLNVRILYDIFNVRRKISIEEYAAICKALCVQLEYFIDDADVKTA